MNGAQRIVCLTEETTETLGLLGESRLTDVIRTWSEPRA
jgi:hypothetical protein